MPDDPYRHARVVARGSDDELCRRVLEPRLQRDEELLWVGRPKLGIWRTPSDSFLIPFSLTWGGSILFWEVMALKTGAPDFFVLCGVPLVLVALYLMLGRFVVDARKRARTFYGVTNQRVLIAELGLPRELMSIDLATAIEVVLTEDADGTGTISLGTGGSGTLFQDSSLPRKVSAGPPALRRVTHAREVFETIRNTQADLRAKPASKSRRR